MATRLTAKTVAEPVEGLSQKSAIFQMAAQSRP